MKKIKITEQLHVLGTTFKDIYEIADYSCKEMPKAGVYVGQLKDIIFGLMNAIISATIIGGVALYLQNQRMRLKTNWKS